MTGMDREIINAVVIAAIYVVIFILGEFVKHKVPSSPELSRKFVHFAGGIVALSFPYFIKSHWTVFILAASFAFIILFTKEKGLLKSVHGIERVSTGGVWFPISIYLMFLLSHSHPVTYFISILVMTVSDTLAALIGVKYGTLKLDVEGNIKSLEGSITFFLVTFLCIHLSLLLMTPIDRLQSVLIAAVIGLLVTGLEAISLSGSDNFFVPFGTYYILAKMTKYPLSESIRLIQILFLVTAVTLIISLRVKSVKWSGIIGMILLNYASWTLCGFRWFLPVFLSEILFFLIIHFFRYIAKREVPGYHIKAVLYTALVPILVIFITNTLDNQGVMYLPFLASNISQTSLITSFFLYQILRKDGDLEIGKRITIDTFSSVISVIVIGLIPVLFNVATFKFISIIILFISVLLAHIFNFLMIKFQKTGEEFEDQRRFHFRVLSTVLSIIFVFIIQEWLLI